MDFWDEKFYSKINNNNDSNTIYKGYKPELSSFIIYQLKELY